MKVRAVIFDLFGTLVPTFPSQRHNKILGKMAKHLGLELAVFAQAFDGRAFRSRREQGAFASLEESLAQVCWELGVHPTERQITQAAALKYQFTREVLQPRQEALAVLNALRSHGYPVGVLSDCPPEVPAVWERTPLASAVDQAVFSCRAKYKKPAPQVYQMLCQRLGVAANQCLYVGDGDSDELAGAQRMGMHPVLIRVPEEEGQDHDRPEMHSWTGRRISSLRDVFQWL